MLGVVLGVALGSLAAGALSGRGPMVAWAGTLPVSLAMALGMLLVLPESARELLARDAPRTEALAALRFLQPQLFDEPGGEIDEARDWIWWRGVPTEMDRIDRQEIR